MTPVYSPLESGVDLLQGLDRGKVAENWVVTGDRLAREVCSPPLGPALIIPSLTTQLSYCGASLCFCFLLCGTTFHLPLSLDPVQKGYLSR